MYKKIGEWLLDYFMEPENKRIAQYVLNHSTNRELREDLRVKRRDAERELEEHNRDKRRFEITANNLSMQEVFFSEDEACRKMNINERKLKECIEKGIPINWDGQTYLLHQSV